MGAPRYPSGPRGPGVRMPQGIGNEFNGVSKIKTWIIFSIVIIHLSPTRFMNSLQDNR